MIYNGHVCDITHEGVYFRLKPGYGLHLILFLGSEQDLLGPIQYKWAQKLGRIVKADVIKTGEEYEIKKLWFPRGKKLTNEEYESAMKRADEWAKSFHWE